MESFVEIFKSSFLTLKEPQTEGDSRWESIRQALRSFDKLNNIAFKMKVYGDVYSLFTEMNSNKVNYFQTLFDLLEKCMQSELTNLIRERETKLQTIKQRFEGKPFVFKEQEEFFLPLEICTIICEYLDFESLFQLRQVNRKWYHVVSASLLWHTPVIETQLLFAYGERMNKKLNEVKTCLRYAETFASHYNYSPSEMYLLLFLETFVLSKKCTILNVGIGTNPLCVRLCEFLRNFQNQILQKEFTVSNYCSKMKENAIFKERNNISSYVPQVENYYHYSEEDSKLEEINSDFYFSTNIESNTQEKETNDLSDLIFNFTTTSHNPTSIEKEEVEEGPFDYGDLLRY